MTHSLIAIILLLVTIHQAIALTVSPQTQNIDVFTSLSMNTFVNITNDFNYTIFYVTLKTENQDIQFIDNAFNLSAGEKKQVKIVIDTSVSYNSEDEIELFYYEKQQVQLVPTQETVHITNTQYDPDSISIIQGSTIRFINDDTIKHSVTSSLFDQELNTNQEYTYTFMTSGIFEYHDKYTNYKGTINVLETKAQEYVHNPSTDQQFTIKIRSLNIETEAELIFVEGQNFSINESEELESVFILKNIGNISISLARFQANPPWISFSRQNLIVKSGDSVYVPFSIFPIITHSNETNKFYNIEIIVKGDNILDKYYNLSVFVPFKANVNSSTIFSRLNQTINEDFAIILFNTICKANPEFPICQPKIVEKIIYKSPTLNFNISQEEFVELRRRILENAQNQEKYYANIQEHIAAIKQNTEQTDANSAETLVLSRKLDIDTTETKGEINSLFVFFVIVAVLIAVLLFVVGVFFIIKKITLAKQEFKT